MLAVQGYYDGAAFHALESVQLKKNQRVIITVLDTVLYLAMKTYRRNNLDFVDCVLFAYSRIKGARIATFDKKLLRLLEG